MKELEQVCRRIATNAGIDGRTSYFAGILRGSGSIVHLLQDATRLEPEKIEQLLAGFASERYAHYEDRRARGLESSRELIDFYLSQGYKRGQVWRNIPLGKTCWDVCIYQQLLQDLRPRTIVEFGTGLGASALFFSDHCKMFGLDTKILTLDINSKDVSSTLADAQDIEFIEGDIKNLSELLPAERLQQFSHPWLVVEDCHNQIPLIVDHIHPLMRSGDYLVIEDIGVDAVGSTAITAALERIQKGTFMVDTFYTDMFGRNLTCSPDSIFRKM